eukprot:UN17745
MNKSIHYFLSTFLRSKFKFTYKYSRKTIKTRHS